MMDRYDRAPSGGASGWSSVTGGPPDAPGKEPQQSGKKKAAGSGTGRVVAVQCIACAVVVLLALLLRTVGGGAYEQLRRSFNDSLRNNGLLNTLAALWDGPPPAESDPDASLPGQTESGTEPSSNSSGDASAQPPESAQPNVSADGDASAAAAAPAASAAGRLPPEGAVAVPLRVNYAACPPLAGGTLTSGYGYREDPTGAGEQFHRGVDIAAPEGAPLCAMFFSRVTEAGESGSLGRYVVLSPGDGVEVLYAHCSAVLVETGTCVRAGETVALVGATGDATGSHVHICVTRDSTVYNPTAIVPVERYADGAGEAGSVSHA